MPHTPATEYRVELPEWLRHDLDRMPDTVSSDVEGMRLVHRLARRNAEEGTGGPFAALVIDSASGAVLAAGVNLVLASGLSSAHAEVVALSLAQLRCGTWNLGTDHAVRELIVNWRPCTQCYGAVLWSGIRRLVIAGDGPELETITGFDEGPMPTDWREQLADRGIALRTGILTAEAIEIFEEYATLVRQGRTTLYSPVNKHDPADNPADRPD